MFSHFDVAQGVLITAVCAFLGIALLAQLSGASWELAVFKGTVALLAVGGLGWVGARVTMTDTGNNAPAGPAPEGAAPGTGDQDR